MKRFKMRSIILGLGVLLPCLVNSATTTFKLGKIGVRMDRPGVVNVGMDNGGTFDGCTTLPTRLHVDPRKLIPDGSLAALQVLLAAKQADRTVTATYVVMPNGLCVFSGVTLN